MTDWGKCGNCGDEDTEVSWMECCGGYFCDPCKDEHDNKWHSAKMFAEELNDRVKKMGSLLRFGEDATDETDYRKIGMEAGIYKEEELVYMKRALEAVNRDRTDTTDHLIEYLREAGQWEAADEIERLRKALQKIANDKLEESSSKWKWQIQDHIRWAKEAIEK